MQHNRTRVLAIDSYGQGRLIEKAVIWVMSVNEKSGNR